MYLLITSSIFIASLLYESDINEFLLRFILNPQPIARSNCVINLQRADNLSGLIARDIQYEPDSIFLHGCAWNVCVKWGTEMMQKTKIGNLSWSFFYLSHKCSLIHTVVAIPSSADSKCTPILGPTASDLQVLQPAQRRLWEQRYCRGLSLKPLHSLQLEDHQLLQ